MITITFMPALLPLEKTSKEQLIEGCKEQRETLIQQDKAIQGLAEKLAQMCRCAHDLGAQLYALVDAYDCNDQAAIAVQLKSMSERRRSFKKPEVH